MLNEKLFQLIQERTSELEKYAQNQNSQGWLIQKENRLLSTLTDIFNELDYLRYQNLWIEVEEYWQVTQRKDQDFNGFQLDVRLKPKGILHYLPLNLYEYGV